MHLIGLAALLGIGLTIALAAAIAYTVRVLTHPPRRSYAWAVTRNLPGDPAELPQPAEYQQWSFTSHGLSLPAWEIAGADPAGPTVIVTHGWGDSRVIALRC